MLEQLQQSLEPILETHGLWLALGLLLLVLVPTLVLFFLRIQQRQGLNTQLQDLLDASGVLYSRLSALDHNLHQYQTQAEGYTGKTQIQVQPLLAPLSENLAQLHRCKVQIKEWEAGLGEQEAETAEQEWLALESEANTLFAGTEKIEGFFKRLTEVEAALQNQLKQIHALLTPYQDRPEQNRPTSQTSLASLKKRLEELESSGPAPDPLMDLEGIRKLLQDVNHWVEAEKQANLAEKQAAEQAAEAAKEETATKQIQPLQTPIAVETESRSVVAPEEVLTPVEAPEPLSAESISAESAPEVQTEEQTEEQTTEQTTEQIPEQVSSTSPTNVVVIDQVLDEALKETQTEVVAELQTAELAAPSPEEQTEVTSEPEPAAEVPLSTTDKAKEAQTKIEARLLREETFLAQQQARFLPHLEEIQQSLTERFVTSLWESSEKQLRRALYKAEEAELLFKLAQRLHQEPAAPTHRVLLNLQRAADKWPEIEKLHVQLQNQHQELELAAEQTLQDCRKLLTLLELPEFDSKKECEDYQVAQSRLAGVITQFESAQALDLAAAQTDLAWVAHCIQSWKVPSNPEEESMVAL